MLLVGEGSSQPGRDRHRTGRVGVEHLGRLGPGPRGRVTRA